MTDGPVVRALLEASFEVVVTSPHQVGLIGCATAAPATRTTGSNLRARRCASHRRASDGLADLCSDDMKALRALVRARKDLIEHRIALSNQLLANLEQTFPGAAGLFAKLDSPISLTFLHGSRASTRQRGYRSDA